MTTTAPPTPVLVEIPSRPSRPVKRTAIVNQELIDKLNRLPANELLLSTVHRGDCAKGKLLFPSGTGPWLMLGDEVGATVYEGTDSDGDVALMVEWSTALATTPVLA
jgi:hypothetical protein